LKNSFIYLYLTSIYFAWSPLLFVNCLPLFPIFLINKTSSNCLCRGKVQWLGCLWNWKLRPIPCQYPHIYMHGICDIFESKLLSKSLQCTKDIAIWLVSFFLFFPFFLFSFFKVIFLSWGIAHCDDVLGFFFHDWHTFMQSSKVFRWTFSSLHYFPNLWCVLKLDAYINPIPWLQV